MTPRRDQDNTVRISIVPNAEGGGFMINTAYQGWRIVESVDGERQSLVDTVLGQLGTVMPGEQGDEIRFVSLAPDGS
jgi:hypothetical protein